jgi:hypothetical protein
LELLVLRSPRSWRQFTPHWISCDTCFGHPEVYSGAASSERLAHRWGPSGMPPNRVSALPDSPCILPKRRQPKSCFDYPGGRCGSRLAKQRVHCGCLATADCLVSLRTPSVASSAYWLGQHAHHEYVPGVASVAPRSASCCSGCHLSFALSSLSGQSVPWPENFAAFQFRAGLRSPRGLRQFVLLHALPWELASFSTVWRCNLAYNERCSIFLLTCTTRSSPTLASATLAFRFRQNTSRRHPGEGPLEDVLTPQAVKITA